MHPTSLCKFSQKLFFNTNDLKIKGVPFHHTLASWAWIQYRIYKIIHRFLRYSRNTSQGFVELRWGVLHYILSISPQLVSGLSYWTLFFLSLNLNHIFNLWLIDTFTICKDSLYIQPEIFKILLSPCPNHEAYLWFNPNHGLYILIIYHCTRKSKLHFPFIFWPFNVWGITMVIELISIISLCCFIKLGYDLWILKSSLNIFSKFLMQQPLWGCRVGTSKISFGHKCLSEIMHNLSVSYI